MVLSLVSAAAPSQVAHRPEAVHRPRINPCRVLDQTYAKTTPSLLWPRTEALIPMRRRRRSRPEVLCRRSFTDIVFQLCESRTPCLLHCNKFIQLALKFIWPI